MNLNFNPLNNTNVEWNKKYKNFSCKISTLDLEKFDDLPQHFNLINLSTNKNILFKFYSKKYNSNNNLIKYIYKSIQGADFVVSLDIINDLVN